MMQLHYKKINSIQFQINGVTQHQEHCYKSILTIFVAKENGLHQE